MSKKSEENAYKSLCKTLDLDCEKYDTAMVMYLASSRINRMKKESGRIELFEDCLQRGLKLWQDKHPEASHWIDGAKNIEWLLEEIKHLEDLKDCPHPDEYRTSDIVAGTVKMSCRKCGKHWEIK